MKLSQFKFKIAPENIGLYLPMHRDEAKLMVLHKDTGEIEHRQFKDIIDYFDDKDTSGFDPHGVCKELIFALREALDKEGFNYVGITVSSSFNAAKIKQWNELKVPVSMYGVGTSFVNNMTCGFTGDLVVLDGKNEAKEGRADYPNPKLHPQLPMLFVRVYQFYF